MNPVIGFVLGSKNDVPQLEGAEAFLKEAQVPYEIRIISAHRTPERAREYAQSAPARGLRLLVGVAGVAAHLSGVLAATAQIPVLGVPAAGGPLEGFDALLSTVQMPAGVPVATFAIGKAGATNAAVFACQVLALSDADLGKRIREIRASQARKVERDDEETKGTRGGAA